MHIITLIISILSVIYAFPYGIWEYKNKNKAGGTVSIFISIICIALAISNFWIE